MRTFLLFIASFAGGLFIYGLGYAACAQKLTNRLMKADELSDIARSIVPIVPDNSIEKAINEYEATKNERP